jgi:hypothetical protein
MNSEIILPTKNRTAKEKAIRYSGFAEARP